MKTGIAFVLTWVVVGDLAQIEDKVRSLGYGEVEVWDLETGAHRAVGPFGHGPVPLA